MKDCILTRKEAEIIIGRLEYDKDRLCVGTDGYKECETIIGFLKEQMDGGNCPHCASEEALTKKEGTA